MTTAFEPMETESNFKSKKRKEKTAIEKLPYEVQEEIECLYEFVPEIESHFVVIDKIGEEDLLMKHPSIADAAVIAVQDDEAGELPKAFVVKQPGARLTENAVMEYVREHAVAHDRLRGGVEFVPEIPKSVSGEILRRLLRGSRPKAKL